MTGIIYTRNDRLVFRTDGQHDYPVLAWSLDNADTPVQKMKKLPNGVVKRFDVDYPPASVSTLQKRVGRGRGRAIAGAKGGAGRKKFG